MKTTQRFAALLCITFCVLNVSTYSKAGNKPEKESPQRSTCINCKGAPEWSSSTSYGNGNFVVYRQRLYRATHWTQGDTPRGFGLFPDGPWLDEGPCF